MKKQFKTLKKFIATLLLATILCSNIAPSTIAQPDSITSFSEGEHSDMGRFPRS